jgi:hypothetical protein
MIREPGATMQPTPQNNQLMSKHRVLSLKPQLRLEWRGQDGQNETEQPDVRQLRRFHYVINSDKVFGTHRSDYSRLESRRGHRTRSGAASCIPRPNRNPPRGISLKFCGSSARVGCQDIAFVDEIVQFPRHLGDPVRQFRALLAASRRELSGHRPYSVARGRNAVIQDRKRIIVGHRTLPWGLQHRR